jgi:uncharacterized protein YbaP (TraB family)
VGRAAAALILAAALALPAAAGERFARGLLWRVSKPGIAPNHVYGTIHVADPRLGVIPAPAREAFERSRSLTLEYLGDHYGRERFLEAAMFLDRQTLEEKIGAEDFARVLEVLKPIGLSREFVNKLKPWGVLLNLRAPQPAHSGATLDAQLLAHAAARRVPVYEMEGIEEQVFVFDEFPMNSQVALLKHALAHREELAAMARETLEAYLARDLAAIWRIQQQFASRHPAIAADSAALVKRVVFDRNVVMAFRMQRQMRRGRAFVALGALHLHGPKGVLALLEQDGWRVQRVY